MTLQGLIKVAAITLSLFAGLAANGAYAAFAKSAVVTSINLDSRHSTLTIQTNDEESVFLLPDNLAARFLESHGFNIKQLKQGRINKQNFSQAQPTQGKVLSINHHTATALIQRHGSNQTEVVLLSQG